MYNTVPEAFDFERWCSRRATLTTHTWWVLGGKIDCHAKGAGWAGTARHVQRYRELGSRIVLQVHPPLSWPARRCCQAAGHQSARRGEVDVRRLCVAPGGVVGLCGKTAADATQVGTSPKRQEHAREGTGKLAWPHFSPSPLTVPASSPNPPRRPTPQQLFNARTTAKRMGLAWAGGRGRACPAKRPTSSICVPPCFCCWAQAGCLHLLLPTGPNHA